ncbi:MAG: DoxX family protein [Chitinophagaceae bacterium]|nr:MAG: DoxX family protein [Chitinophagaceae bacterium]
MKKNVTRISSWSNADIAALVLRLGFGILMIPHGLFKLNNFDEIVGEFMSFAGLGSKISLWSVIIVEIGCSALLILGLATRLALIPLLVTACVIVFISHGGDIFGEAASGFSFLLAYITIFFLGGGKYSLDYLMSGKTKQRHGLR